MPDQMTDPALLTAPARTRRRRWPWLAGALAIGLGVLGGAAWWHGDAAPPLAPAAAEAPPSLTVTLAPVQRRVLAREVIGDGSVVAWQELVIGAETGGLRVLSVPVEEGEPVRQGQLLVALDDALPAAQMAQSRAALAEAEAALSIARLDLRRASELSRTGNVAREILDQRQSAVQQAEARLLAAQARQGEAEVRMAQTRILAPFDGVVARRSVLPGAVVQPGQEMARLIRDNRLELDARVPELDLAALRPGQAVRVLHGDREIAASIRAVAPVVAGETRLGIVHVALPAGSGLRPGMFARAEIRPETAPALVVPQEAVVFRAGQAVAFVLPEGGDRVMRREVATGARQEGLVAVTSGLAEGERVVASGAGFLSDGDRVRVTAPR
ncbi:efflux RND transporter periplasmic adaptor subunit [Teichococcus vastitatis]|uniref:Efflux RND transporter periplasmic adaptor subunit n=1 Tax=Teichococcus vastitatis TaxID=2307076 RepID=A0ABS9VZA1_9PROT|nr:efflux RND transporter periplasmic adaptor subunit [Pseudoroseomonas vastitatis]MCI0752331.1 efflux RND transporter periplasmic adaptor subunit [Pseudoroseomonas vastitatis]